MIPLQEKRGGWEALPSWQDLRAGKAFPAPQSSCGGSVCWSQLGLIFGNRSYLGGKQGTCNPQTLCLPVLNNAHKLQITACYRLVPHALPYFPMHTASNALHPFYSPLPCKPQGSSIPRSAAVIKVCPAAAQWICQHTYSNRFLNP